MPRRPPAFETGTAVDVLPTLLELVAGEPAEVGAGGGLGAALEGAAVSRRSCRLRGHIRLGLDRVPYALQTVAT